MTGSDVEKEIKESQDCVINRAQEIITERAKKFILNDKKGKELMVDFFNSCEGDYDVDYSEFLDHSDMMDDYIPGCGVFTFDQASHQEMDEFLISEYFDLMADNKATDIMTGENNKSVLDSELPSFEIVADRKYEILKRETYVVQARDFDEAVKKVKDGLICVANSVYIKGTEEPLSAKESYAIAECDVLIPDDNGMDYEENNPVFEVIEDECKNLTEEENE